MKDIRQRLLATFQVEHKEHVQRIRGALAALGASDQVLAATDLDEVFRRAHSLKGAARAVDLRPLEGLAHRLETLFSRVREGVLRLDEAVIRVIYQVLDASEDWLAAIGGAAEPAPPEQALAAIDALLGTPAAVPAPATAAPSAAPKPGPPAPAPGPVAPVDTLRLNAESLDRIVSSAGQLLSDSLRQNEVTRQLRQVSAHLSETASERDRVRASRARIFQQLDSSPELAATARYVNYLDHQIQIVTRQVDATIRAHEQNAWALRSLAGELQRDVRQARMVPAENVFDGFRKMVRDLARDAGKAIELHASGWQVEADRLVLQALKDPVMHMLRNAISHGLEFEADRESAGKRPEGRIDLIIDVRGTQLRIAVEDDGRGMDLVRIAEIAVRKGLLSAADVQARSPAELMRLV
ncbi:MAG: Hpt domain-containing protein, partial [Vicinamibacterales bacterium]